MVAIHGLWLVSTLVEGLMRGPVFPAWWFVPLAVFLAVQPLRYWAILSLGENWNVRVLVSGFYPFSALDRATEDLDRRHSRGVVVVGMDPSAAPGEYLREKMRSRNETAAHA